jgi:hypothetical protein
VGTPEHVAAREELHLKACLLMLHYGGGVPSTAGYEALLTLPTRGAEERLLALHDEFLPHELYEPGLRADEIISMRQTLVKSGNAIVNLSVVNISTTGQTHQRASWITARPDTVRLGSLLSLKLQPHGVPTGLGATSKPVLAEQLAGDSLELIKDPRSKAVFAWFLETPHDSFRVHGQ